MGSTKRNLPRVKAVLCINLVIYEWMQQCRELRALVEQMTENFDELEGSSRALGHTF